MSIEYIVPTTLFHLLTYSIFIYCSAGKKIEYTMELSLHSLFFLYTHTKFIPLEKALIDWLLHILIDQLKMKSRHLKKFQLDEL